MYIYLIIFIHMIAHLESFFLSVVAGTAYGPLYWVVASPPMLLSGNL